MRLFILVFLFALFTCKGQNTMSFEEGAVSPKADLLQVSWIAGHWKGEAFGGIVEEIWSPPLGGSMMFSFKHILDGKVNFYELGHIQEIEGSLRYQLKHFGGDLKGWEEKEEVVSAKLVQLDKNRVYFDDFTFEKISNDEINIYVVLENGEQSEEVKFNYKRVSK